MNHCGQKGFLRGLEHKGVIKTESDSSFQDSAISGFYLQDS